jgi:RNA polymerase sigma factor (sigma-70 family)
MPPDDKTPDASPHSAYAAGWSMPESPEVPLEAMHIADEPAASYPAPSPPIAFGLTDEATAPPAPDDAAYADRFDVGPPSGPPPSAPVIASALLNEPQQEGLRYLFNYANKSIRKNRGVSEQDRDDLLHDIYMEWWICTGFEVAALPKLLDSESPERQSLRESIYRVFGRYRYHQTAHRTNELGEGDALAEDPNGARDFAIDLKKWLTSLPDLEAKIIDLYYFQHKTMDEIGAEIGMAKQRVSEIHKRALAKHPDAPP